MSKGENKIVDLLNKSKIKYTREKTFSDLKQGQLRYDFYFKDVFGADCIVEYNGEQHYQFIKKFYKTPLEWRKAQGRDMRKISYCLAHNIKLYIIPYWEIDNIKCVEDLLQEKFRARDRYKNFTDYEIFSASRDVRT